MKKINLLVERLVVCYYVLTVPTFAFFSCGGRDNPKNKVRCYAQNVFSSFNAAVSEFSGNDFNVSIQEQSIDV